MKKILLLTAVVVGLFISNINAKTFHRSNFDVDFFFPALEPYGEWIEIGYDDYVWRPYDTDRFWKPYSEGRWEWTRHGWYWVSYEPYGWATYHYGRWFYDDYYGWVWMPDNTWGPSWVEWRYDNSYIGWAPLPPYAAYRPHRGIHFSIRWHSKYNHWSFVTYNNFVSVNVHHHFIDSHKSKRIFSKTKYRTNYLTDNNRVVNGGIDRKYVERKIGKKLTTRTITNSDSRSNIYKNNSKDRNRILEYKPTNSDISRKNDFDRSKVTKGKTLKSLDNSKVAIRKNYETNNSKVIKKNDERKSSKITTIKNDERTVIKKNNSPKVVESKRTITKKSSTPKMEANKKVEKNVIKKNSSSKTTKKNSSIRKPSTTKTEKKSSTRNVVKKNTRSNTEKKVASKEVRKNTSNKSVKKKSSSSKSDSNTKTRKSSRS